MRLWSVFPALMLLSAVAAGADTDQDGVVVGLGFNRLAAQGSGFDTYYSLAEVTLGYRAYAGEGITFTPELRAGVGLNDERLGNDTVSIDGHYGFALRVEAGTGNVYVVLAPSYSRYEGDSTNLPAASEQDWKFGVGFGIGFRIGEATAMEITYEGVDETDIVGVAFRVNF